MGEDDLSYVNNTFSSLPDHSDLGVQFGAFSLAIYV